MSKTLLLIIGSVVILGFVYMHFEWFPGHTGPDRASAQVEIRQWAEQVSGVSNPDVRITHVSVPDGSGVAGVDVAFHNFYYEAGGSGQRYSGKGRVDFVRVGPMFRPRWTISRVTLLDKERPQVLPVSTQSRGGAGVPASQPA